MRTFTGMTANVGRYLVLRFEGFLIPAAALPQAHEFVLTNPSFVLEKLDIGEQYQELSRETI